MFKLKKEKEISKKREAQMTKTKRTEKGEK